MPSDAINGLFYPRTAASAAEVVDALQHHPGGPTGYRLRRVFLVQYWRWEYEIVEIPHGRLFLTGKNASGKTTALTAAMVLLDGSLRPERLDTSGRRSRQIADYVLLRTSANDSDEEQRLRYPQRNSYVAAEFECLDPELLVAPLGPDGRARPETVTIGMAFVGRQHGQVQVETTYFVLADGSRLERDIPLLTNSDQVYAPRALFGFNFAGFPGRFSTRNLGEYQQLVAEHLFGYDDPADLEQLTEWLAHLRRPDIAHATASLAALTDRLKTALPPLAESVAEKLVEAFEQLAELRRDRARSYDQLAACQAILKSSNGLAVALVRQRAWWAARAADDERKRQRNLRDHQRDAARILEQIAQSEADFDRLRREQEQYAGQIAAIRSSALLRDHEARIDELNRRQDDLDLARRDADGLAWQVEQSRASRERASVQLDRLTAEWHVQQKAGESQIGELVTAVRQIGGERDPEGTPLAVLASRTAKDRLDADDFSVGLVELAGVSDLLADWLRRLTQIDYLLASWRQVSDRADRLDEQVRSQRDVVDQTIERREAGQSELTQAWARLDPILDGDAGDPTGDATALAQIRRFLSPLRDASGEANLTSYRAAVATAVLEIERLAQDLEATAAHVDETIGVARQRLAVIQGRRQGLETSPDWNLLDEQRAPERVQAREVLARLGIAARPLYEIVDLRADLDERAGGQIERMLLDAGLLDALVIRPPDEERAIALLTREGLRDVLLGWRLVGAEAPDHQPHQALIVDPALPDDGWRRVAEQVLRRLSLDDDRPLSWQPDGSWRHGAVVGAAGAGGPLGFLGTTRRQTRRLAEISALREQEAAILAEVDLGEARRERLRAGQEAFRAAVRRLERSATDAGLDVAIQRLADQERALVDAQQALDGLIERNREVDDEERAGRDRLGDAAAAFELTAEQMAADQVLGRIRSNHSRGEQSLALYRQTRFALHATWQRYHEVRGQLAEDRARLAEQEHLLQTSRERQARLEGAIQQLRNLLDGVEYQTLLAELEQLSATFKVAEARARSVETALAEDRVRLTGEQERIAEYQSQVDDARLVRERADTALKDHLSRLRSAALDEARRDAEAGRLDLVVQQLIQQLGPDLEGIDEEDLEHGVTAARKEFGDSYNEHRARIKHVAPVPNLDDGRVVVETTSHGACSLAEYVGYLGEEIALQESLIEEKHERFYKEVLMRHAAREIRDAIARADEWLAETGELLRGLPFAQQHYSFILKPNLQSSTALARVLDVFRKSEATFTDHDAERLRQALVEEAEALRRDFERGDQSEFRRLLDDLFDYRSWINVEVRVNGRALTERATQAASGGEQAFDFAVPLVVALAALYRNAKPFAPRLIAFDEAFMKASADNKGQMIRLLQHLGFQWLIASPDLPSRGVPVYAEYHLEYRHGDERAEMTPLLAVTDAENSVASNGHLSVSGESSVE